MMIAMASLIWIKSYPTYISSFSFLYILESMQTKMKVTINMDEKGFLTSWLQWGMNALYVLLVITKAPKNVSEAHVNARLWHVLFIETHD